MSTTENVNPSEFITLNHVILRRDILRTATHVTKSDRRVERDDRAFLVQIAQILIHQPNIDMNIEIMYYDRNERDVDFDRLKTFYKLTGIR